MPTAEQEKRIDELEREQVLARVRANNQDVETLAKLLSRRYSCRAFRPDALPKHDIETLFSLAQLTASWCNSQPWHVTIAAGAAMERLRTNLFAYAQKSDPNERPDFDFPRSYSGKYRIRRLDTAIRLYNSIGVGKDREASRRQSLENFRCFGAPCLALITTEAELGVYGAVDCGLFVANLILLAEAMGVAAIPQAALARFPNFMRGFFGLPANRLVVCGVALGYADDTHAANAFRTPRARVEDAMTWVED